MQWLAKICVQRPVFAAVIILTLCVAGVFTFTQLNVERFPNIDVPAITVTTTLAGASAEEMDTEVTDVIEKEVNTISGVDSITSTSSEGVSTVSISFVMDKNGDSAFAEVQSKVNQAIPSLPTNAKQPVIQKMIADSMPVLSFTLTSSNASIRDLTEYADKTLRPQFESLNGVGQVSIVGGQKRQINITLDPYKLRSYNLPISTVKNAIASQNIQTPAGAINQGDRRITVRTAGRYTSVDALKSLVITQRSGQLIRLGDIATIEDGSEEQTTIAHVNGSPAVMLEIHKQSGVNTIKVVDTARSKLEEVKLGLPKGYNVTVTRDDSTYVRAAVGTVEEHLILGAFLAAIVVLIFLWDIRATIIASLAIPSSIIATFTLMWARGFTLNLITLLALTLSVGIVIDDAILVLENIYRFIDEKKMKPVEATIAATNEIGLAVMATTLSLIAVFLPVAFMSGMLGRFLTSFGLTMSFAIMVSLVVAFTLTPMLASRWLRSHVRKNVTSGDSKLNGASRTKQGLFNTIEVLYGNIVRWALHHRAVVITVCVIAFISIVPLIMIVNKEFIPQDDESQFELSVQAPTGSSLAVTGNLLDNIAEKLHKYPDVQFTLVSVGSDSQNTMNKGTILVQMEPIDKRKSHITQSALMDKVRRELIPIYPKDIIISAVPPGPTGGGAQAAISYVINGPNLDVLNATSEKLIEKIRKIPGVADVTSSASTGNPELCADINRDNAADLGASAQDIGDAIQVAVQGLAVSSYAEGGRRYDINLRGAPEYRRQQNDIGLYLVTSTKDNLGSVPLSQVVNFTETTSAATIKRYARSRQITLSVNIKPGTSQAAVQNAIAQQFSAIDLGTQYRGQFGGTSKQMNEVFSSFLAALVLSFLFVYLILAAQFESWLHPFTILISLPLSVPFALLSLVITGGALNMFSLLGTLVLFGIVKKNSILQVNHTIQLRDEGYEREDAIVTACRNRLRPILMTTIAFVAGMLPLAFSSGVGAATNHAIGDVIIGGQTLSLLLTLVATPVFYSVSDDFANFIMRIKSKIFHIQNQTDESVYESDQDLSFEEIGV